MLTCKNATQLISEAQDRPLTRRERFALRLHLMLCVGCRRFEGQIAFLRRACQGLFNRES